MCHEYVVMCIAGDVRASISDFLRSVGRVPLGLRTNDEGGVAADKFYEGGHWHTFCCGGGKAAGGPVIVATLVKLVADYYEELTTTADRERVLRT
eukprot:2244639-Pleurochrysis_carterae.AAC.2